MILIVDDHDDIRWAIHRLLTFSGMDAQGVSSGAEALQAARDLKPEVMVLDVMMPGMDGIEVLKHLRADPATNQIPVLLHTAGTYPPSVDEARRLGADGLIKKGRSDITALLDQIESLRHAHHYEI